MKSNWDLSLREEIFLASVSSD